MTPEIISRYLAAADEKDPEALAGCFTSDGTVVDEGETYTGPAEIAGWRTALIGKFTFTTTLTGTEPIGDDECRVHAHVEGDFPGGVSDLTYRFTIREQRIAALVID